MEPGARGPEQGANSRGRGGGGSEPQAWDRQRVANGQLSSQDDSSHLADLTGQHTLLHNASTDEWKLQTYQVKLTHDILKHVLHASPLCLQLMLHVCESAGDLDQLCQSLQHWCHNHTLQHGLKPQCYACSWAGQPAVHTELTIIHSAAAREVKATTKMFPF